MPGGITATTTVVDRTIQQVVHDSANNFNRHHDMYESDRVLYSVDGNTEQLLMERILQSVRISEIHSKTRHTTITPETVSEIFNVGIGRANDILSATTQRGVRHAVTPLTRRYRIDHIHLNHTYLAGKWTMDHMESKYKSIRGHTGAIIFTNGNLVMVYPTPTKNDADCTESLRRFTEDIGIPANLKCDMATSFVGHHTDFQRLVRKLGVNITYSEPYRHNQLQQVDMAIRELKRRWRYVMGHKNVPRQLWCFGLEHQARLLHYIPRGHFDRTGYEMVTGKTPDISEYLDFNFYDLVWYWRNNTPSMSEHDRELARWMGVAHRIGADMCYWLMPVSGIPIVNSTVQHVTAEDLRSTEIKERVDDFNRQVDERLDDTNFVLLGKDIDYFYPNDVYEVPEHEIAKNGDGENVNDLDDPDAYDNLIGATFLLDPVKCPENVATKATVICHKTDHLGNPLGRAHRNPLLDTRQYEVQLEDGTYDSYFANTIAENLFSQCDAEGREFNVVRDIIGHRSDGRALSKDDGYTGTGTHRKPKKTLAGWSLNVEFSDGNTQWLPL